MRAREKRKAIEKRQVLMFYRLGKTSTKKKPQRDRRGQPPNPPLVRPKVKTKCICLFATR